MENPIVARRTIPLLTAAALVLAACGGGEDAADTTAATGALTIVATTSVLGDVVTNIVGAAATVEVIMGAGVDPHDFQPSPQQAAAIQSADLVIAVGLGLEEGLLDVIASAENDGTPVIELAAQLDPIAFAGSRGDESGGEDPHFWQDPSRMATAVELIADRLGAIDGSVDWGATAAAYAAQLRALDAAIDEQLASIPAERRKIVTNHDAFGYFADRYGFEIVGVVIPGGSTLAEPSAADLAGIVATIEEERVTAIFAENTNPAVLAEAVAAELGGEVRVFELHSDSLGEPGSPAATYIGLLRTNAATVAGALS